MNFTNVVTGITRATTPGTATASCEPWCVLHDSTNPGEEICTHIPAAVCSLGTVRLESINGQVVLWGLEDANEGMFTVEQAHEYAQALLRAVSIGRVLSNGSAA